MQGDQFEITSSHIGPDGEIFFGGSNGLTFFHPQQITDNPYPPQTVFTDFQLFNQSIAVGSALLPLPIEKTQKITLTSEQSVFTLKFAALSYQISSKNLYQYQLVGFDKDWSPARTNQEATYTNLSPGTYTFMVRTANNDGVWNDTPGQLVIEILPPWWETWWFRSIALLSILLLIVGGVQFRLRGIQSANRELEKRVNGRTQELQSAQEKLKKQLDEITALEKIVREQSIHDALTNLYNRHFLSESMEIEFSHAQRSHQPIAFLLMDLDHFKDINDIYGHQAGDHALEVTAQTVIAQIRRSDIAFRYGGEEFMVIMPEITVEDAFQRAERLCKVIDNLIIKYEANTIRITVSIGIAVYPFHGKNGDEILSKADTALYQAKNSGRNKVVLYNSEIK